MFSSTLTAFAYKSYEPNQTLDTHMSPQERQESGLHKLTPEERQALQNWINKHHYVRPGVKQYNQRAPEVSEVIGNGAFVKLSDGSIWHIHPGDRLLTQSWISAAEIGIEYKGGSNYGYILENKLTGSTVRAEKSSKIPDYFTTPSQNRYPAQPGSPSAKRSSKPPTMITPQKEPRPLQEVGKDGHTHGDIHLDDPQNSLPGTPPKDPIGG
ncbi:MAG: hypothetical protein AAGF04_00360 [Chlamydiota bacterium]